MNERGASRGGGALGAVVFAGVLVAVLAGGYAWLQGRHNAAEAAAQAAHRAPRRTPRPRPPVAQGADKWTGLLGKFLATGPEGGTWETRFLSCVYTHYLAPHPEKKDLYLIAQVTATDAPSPKAVSRWLVPRQFFRAPASLFFSNYARSLAPVQEELDDGTPTLRVHWRPRSSFDDLVDTERRVWFETPSLDVVQVEDISRSGHLIRRVRRISKDTGAWDFKSIDPSQIDQREIEPPDPHADPDRTLRKVAREAPFPIYVPATLPPGFVLVRASYTVFDPVTPAGTTTGPVHLASQLYSDGLALISIGIAPRGEMSVIERMSAGMTADIDDPAACPTLPVEPRSLKLEDGSVIRLRTDTCRTVMRRDDLDEISVTLIGRNELPTEEYLHMINDLARIAPAGAGDAGARQGAGQGDGEDPQK